MSDVRLEISIPTDNEGFALLQCSICGDYFKVKPSDYEDDGILELHCPSCGLCGENFFTEDVIDLALTMAKNVATDMIFDELKKMERQFRGSMVSIKVNKKAKNEHENPVSEGIEALAITAFPCCKRYCKIKPMLKISGCYCPFCGVKEYETE